LANSANPWQDRRRQKVQSMNARSITDYLEHHARSRGSAVAVVCGEEVLDFATLRTNALRVARRLTALGLKPGARTGYFAYNAPQFAEMLLGCAYGGQVLTGINWRLAPPEIAYIINDAEIRVLVTERAFLEQVEAVRAQCPTLEHVVLLDMFAAWRDAAPADGSPIDVPLAGSGPDDVVLQLYTSGTTGFPKGALLANSALVANVRRHAAIGEAWSTLGPDSVELIAMPLFHVAGTSMTMQIIAAGGRIVYLPRAEPEAILHAIETQGINRLFIVPAALNTLINHPRAAHTDFSSLRFVVYGASPIPLDVLRRAMSVMKCGFVQQFGTTETNGSLVYLPAEEHDPAGTPRMLAAGRPMPGAELRIVDGAGQATPVGTVGEIWVRSDQVMAGYWKKPEATAAVLTADGWYKTGDAGYLDAEGYLYIHDRVKDMIVSGGENVYPAEVESALHEHPDVMDCAVIGVPDPTWGEAVKAIVVLHPGRTLQAADLIAFARPRIAGYKVPKSVDFVTELPRNPSGKILKRELRKPYWPEGGRMVG